MVYVYRNKDKNLIHHQNNTNTNNKNNDNYNNDDKTKGFRVIPEALKQLRDLLITTLVLPSNKKKEIV